ncbi:MULTISPECIES: hypothetical protein [Enterobacteriaceae]|uniref:hypothetical protein n=1 Tax=Enterobacteriaceae TaxID=543 RepID=UPI0012FF1C88|nr:MULTISPECIES: hypothetical protein [Enterobacteriaceae]
MAEFSGVPAYPPDMFHAKQAQAEMQRQQKQQLEEMNRRQQERINRLRSGIY